ncbi:Protein PLASTID MOVEMENT IMPAIRED 2 [Acorus calamus]|uniref:Protein PLASTID MOVEMENT IMPAIRED 2 n=1 Tax=Acorus calamus TaxID=4465 RepID=A0AAV9DDW7_ACOCL|nr:Protein PLASTID MOVEMENT IMPAIRED 2 [Acorus calamus]
MNQLSKDESGNQNLLESAMAELEAAKKELSRIKEEGFQCMSAMDILRDRLRHIYEEMGKLKKSEEKADSTIQMLNSKLLRAKSKLESATTASKTAKAIASNLSAALEQLQTEKESMEKERELINEETKTIKAEMENAESKIELAEERLEAALQELESVKVSEGIALENLRALTEKTVTARASMCMQNSTITISRFEYEYLSSHAEGAKEIADKRVAAAQAWLEALKAGERETLGKIESCYREADEMRLMEEQEKQKSEKLLKAKKEVEQELHRAQKLNEATDVQIVLRPPRRSVKENSMTASRRRSARIHRPNLPGKYAPRSPSITLKRRTKVMPNLAKFFRGKRSKQQ